MRKNRMMRVASALLVVVLLTTCAISGTFAKYVTEKSASAEARVAKWGVEFVAASDELFKPEYDYETTPTDLTTQFSVQSDNAADVVAPGTSGTNYSFKTIHPNGDPEVSYEVTFAVTGENTIYLDEYYPVRYTLKVNDVTLVPATTDLSAVMDYVEDFKFMFDVTEHKYYIWDVAAGKYVPHASAPQLVLSWEWVYEVDDATDVKDTTLGYLAAGYDIAYTKSITGYAGTGKFNLSVNLGITATATQID